MVEQTDPTPKSGTEAASTSDAEDANAEDETEGTRLVYALVLEQIKQACGLTLQTAELERKCQQQQNANVKICKKIEDHKLEKRYQEDDIRLQDNKSKELSMEMNRLKDTQNYLSMTLFQDSDLTLAMASANKIVNQPTPQQRNESQLTIFADYLETLNRKCTATNLSLAKELDNKKQESAKKARLNARKVNIDKIRDETKLMRQKTEEHKMVVGQRAKELVGYENQQRITMQALDRETAQITKEQGQVDIIKLRTNQLCSERYQNLVKLEEQADQIEELMEEKARLLRQKNELTNLMKTVENNIEPKRFKSAVGKSAAPADGLDELHDFDSS